MAWLIYPCALCTPIYSVSEGAYQNCAECAANKSAGTLPSSKHAHCSRKAVGRKILLEVFYKIFGGGLC